MGDLISNIKEFIWDIIGYLIPGFFLIIIFNFVVLPVDIESESFMFDWNLFFPYVLIVVAYILGYIVYSFTRFKIILQDQALTLLIKLLDKIKMSLLSDFLSKYKSDYWEIAFKKSTLFLNAIDHLKEVKVQNTEKLTVREARNILMSKDPSMDEKIYTFMFRSSVFDHVSTIFCLLIIAVIFQYFYAWEHTYFLKTSELFKVIYIITIPVIYLLGNCKRIFFPIAMRLPFSNLKYEK